MFNGMMDPEFLKLAQEQMNRMPPAELAKIQQQMMANPELMRMASQSMKNMMPEDLRQAAQHLRPGEMAEMSEKMANSSPEDFASMRARADAELKYEISAAQMLKKQGNELHSQGKFRDALQKYSLAKKNLQGLPSSQGRSLLLACSLNMMSCYLKTKQYHECIKEGSEVLGYDERNVKALYRRGQAYKELGLLKNAVSDLSKAQEVSPDDETVADVLRDAKERLAQDGGNLGGSGVVIEEINEEDDVAASSQNIGSSKRNSMFQQEVNIDACNTNNASNGRGLTTDSEPLQASKDDPEAIRTFQNFISNVDPETLSALNGAKARELPPEMLRTASNIIGKMSPQELQKMLQMASSFQGANTSAASSSSNVSFDSSRPGSVFPNVTSDMLKTASDMMSKMPPEELQNMFQMASSLRGTETASTAAYLNNNNGLNTDSGSKLTGLRENFAVMRNSVDGETSSSNGFFQSSRDASQPTFANSTSDMQEQARNQMKDPAMRQMFTSMMKNMSPDMMANMSAQFGMKFSPEDAAKAQQAMSSLSPEDLDRMMQWADRIQRGAEGAKKAKNWLLGRPGMILAICMLIFAVVLHWLGFIGK